MYDFVIVNEDDIKEVIEDVGFDVEILISILIFLI